MAVKLRSACQSDPVAQLDRASASETTVELAVCFLSTRFSTCQTTRRRTFFQTGLQSGLQLGRVLLLFVGIGKWQFRHIVHGLSQV